MARALYPIPLILETPVPLKRNVFFPTKLRLCPYLPAETYSAIPVKSLLVFWPSPSPPSDAASWNLLDVFLICPLSFLVPTLSRCLLWRLKGLPCLYLLVFPLCPPGAFSLFLR